MTRTVALLILSVLLVGCTRYSTRAQGPFGRKHKSDPFAAIPPGPAANNSPLALPASSQPEPPPPPGDGLLVPPRTGQPAVARPQSEPTGGVLPAGGVLPDDDAAAFPPKRRPEPQPTQLPSPFEKDQTRPQPQPQPLPSTPVRPAPAASAPAPAAETPQSAGAKHIAEIKKLHAGAVEKWNTVDTYESQVTRRELSPAGKMTEDVVHYQFRKEPMAVYIRNLGESGKGREILYNPKQFGDKIHAIVGEGDGNLLFKVGSKAPAVTPDSPFVKDKSRYSIREAGYGTPINRVATWVSKVEAGKLPADAMTSLGMGNRPEFAKPVAGVQLRLRPGDDPLLPNGGTRQWFFDRDQTSPSFGLPLLIIATEPDGKVVEYYLFEKLKFNTQYPEADFNPDRLNKKK
ncbi:Hypothetical conserved protein OS=uncultured planctomycete GN=HGMM_F09D09C08 PE=4 SV=1 [Gemmataceae bacterium]|nr:Hypothetical conserved protein OS=uncultured planctomycete GN=HGMM_F09D09C08 PE=4 SV=1 [Gemmataceae bacterium]VTU00563.1 Hypothetical conserved protein OS=uncultured planctomycete GN=HGMM_F09D09C08 PE=4 SV=1 [Gemmataceae bacterium]